MNSGIRYSALAAAVLTAIYLAPVRTAAQAPGVAPAPATSLPWAYPLSPPAVPNPNPPPPDPTVLHVPNSQAGFTRQQIGDGFNPPDWHPAGHPAMPNLVAHGRREDVRACGFCHLPNAQGRPENAGLAGLPQQYIEQQVSDYRNGLRQSSEPNMGPPANMLKLAKASNAEEVKPAAEYFSKLTFKPWITVKETKMVPKTKAVGGMWVVTGKEMEPIGARIIETPEELENTEKRDDGSPFIAYVPVGAVKKGEALATKANAKTTQCAICHGEGLKGLGNVPFLAGRSPSYIVRQMNDIKSGARHGGYAPLMKGVVEKLTNEDMLNIAAYTSSLKPPTTGAGNATH